MTNREGGREGRWQKESRRQRRSDKKERRTAQWLQSNHSPHGAILTGDFSLPRSPTRHYKKSIPDRAEEERKMEKGKKKGRKKAAHLKGTAGLSKLAITD